MKKFCHIIFFCILFFNVKIFCFSLNAREYIESFHSDITVHKDASMTVSETIVYVNNGKRVRGIFREFPTVYRYYGFNYITGFDLLQVLKNGKKENYYLDRPKGGKRIRIGHKDVFLRPGKYIYKITYNTNKQLGFFDTYDELYWNVNGTNWRLPIGKVSARILLPKGIEQKDIELIGYTGKYGEKGKDYKAEFDQDGRPVFYSTKPFVPGENLSIVVMWPKGFVKSPGVMYKVYYFLKDNMFFIISLILFLFFLIFALNLYLKKRRSQFGGPIIPLFYPPVNLTPADVRYIHNIGYDSKVFAAQIVDMAVKGLITIEYEKTFWAGGTYTLIKNQEHINKKDLLKHGYILDVLFFGGRSSIKLDKKNYKIISSAVKKLERTLKKDFTEKLFLSREKYYFVAIPLLIWFFINIIISPQEIIQIALSVLFFVFFLLCNYLLKGYTKDGLVVKNEIEGFKLFLSTTEEDRLKVIGTPPTKTPQLYETYLPYAIALGVEKQWSKKFAPVFDVMKQKGHPYVPIWYVGAGGFDSFDTSSFATDLSRSLTRDSGKSGGGSSGSGRSGGGGGGGGGGSW